jgi:hypothetical protein
MDRFETLLHDLTEGMADVSELHSDPKTRIFVRMANQHSSNREQWDFDIFNKVKKDLVFSMRLESRFDGFWNGHTGSYGNYRGKGYGALGYDIAMELVTYQKHKIGSSTLMYGHTGGANTEDSSKVWEYYYKKRNDVTKTEFRDLPPEIQSLHNDDPDLERAITEKPWLFAVYEKKDTSTVQELMEKGLIKFIK